MIVLIFEIDDSKIIQHFVRCTKPFKMKKALFFILSICSLTVFAQTNIGFEDGTVTGWECKSGFYGAPAGDFPCATPPQFIFKYNSTTPLDGAKDSPLDPTTKAGKTQADFRHTIMTTAAPKDPNSKNNISPVAPGNLFPTGTNKYSFRLGNSVGLADYGQTEALAEAIKMTYLVDKNNAGLTYLYSAFLFDYAHPTNEAPRFEIKITQIVNGKEEQITCGYYQISAADPSADFQDGAGFGKNIWRYTNWTKVTVDLTAYVGKQVSIEFATADCFPNDKTKSTAKKCVWSPGSHAAYAYIDLYTSPVEIASPSICANAPSIQLCALPGYASYQWPSGQPGIQPPLDKQCVKINNPKAGDTYTVNMVSTAGPACKTTMTITLKGTDFTVSDTSVCTNTLPFKINAIPATPGDYVWKWEPKQNLSCYDCPNPEFTPGTTTTYTVTMTDKKISNCDRIKNVTINVGTSFTVKTTSDTICEGETGTITATGADTYTWQPGSLTGATQTVTPTTTTTYTVTGASASATCPGDAKATAIVTVDKKPIVAVTDVTICAGETATLTGSITGGGSTGTWIGGDGQFSPNRATLNATYKPTPAEIASKKITLTLESEDPSGPCGKESKTLTITISPGAKADAGPDVTICFGGTAELAAPDTGGVWSGGTLAGFSDVKNPKASYTPTPAEQTAGKITLTYTTVNTGNASCPGGSDEMVITIEKLSVSAGADKIICFGETAKLSGSIGGSATKGTWKGNGVFSKNNQDLEATYTPTQAEMVAGTVTLYLTTDATEACPAKTDSMVISINPVAIADAGPHQAICYPGTVTLAGVISGSATSGTWSGGSGTYSPSPTSATATYTPSASEASAGKALLTYTTNDPLGPCPAVSDTMSITVYKKAEADAGKTASFCIGSPILLNGKITGGNGTGIWSGGLGGVYIKSVTDLNASYTPTPADIAAGKVIFTLKTSATGLCPMDSATVTHLINPSPVINFVVDTPKACPPHCVDFTDSTVAMGSNIVKWEWDFGNQTTGIVKNPKDICYPQPGSYNVSLKATTDKGCVAKLEKPYMIETYPKPIAQFTVEPNPVSLWDPTVRFYDQSSRDVKTWVWNLGDGKIIFPNIKNPVHQYVVGLAKTYTVTLTVTNAYGCIDSIPHAVEVQPEFTFYIPNAFTPGNSEKVNDTFFGKGVGIIEYHLWVFDRWGNMVFNTKDINTGWDGRANNGADIAQQDVYVWKVKLKDVFNKNHEYIGTVTLVR